MSKEQLKIQRETTIKTYTKVGLKPSYNQNDLVEVINGLIGNTEKVVQISKESSKSVEIKHNPKAKVCIPSELKKGDMFLGYSINGKCRPFIVVNVLDADTCAVIPLTTTDDLYALIPCKSRFLEKASFISNQVHLAKTEFVKSNFIGVFDNTRAINKAIEILQPQYPALLKRKFNKSLTK